MSVSRDSRHYVRNSVIRATRTVSRFMRRRLRLHDKPVTHDPHDLTPDRATKMEDEVE